MVLFRPSQAALLVAVVVLISPTCLSANEPVIQADPFTAEADHLLQTSLKIDPPKDDDFDVLFYRQTLKLESDGRRTQTRYRLERYLTRQAVNQMGFIGASWSPWREEKPQIRARVISPDGTVHELDSTTISESTAESDSPRILSDERVLRAPLPALEPGCLVEFEITTQESKTFCKAGIRQTLVPQTSGHVHRAELNLEFPEGMFVRVEPILITDPPQVGRSEGIERQVFSFENLKPIDFAGMESFTPATVHHIPFVQISTGKEWNAIVQEYAAMLPKVHSKHVGPIVTELGIRDQPRDTAVELCLKYLREKVRYTGLEFGAQAIVPRTPDQTLLARYGDCKDQSLLLVEMLREAGHDASLALVHTRGLDHRQKHPALDSFNHAIVYVAGGKPLWLDPTQSFQRPGTPPNGLTGELALVIGKPGMVRIPELPASKNRISMDYSVDVRNSSDARVVCDISYTGNVESTMRSSYANMTQTQAEEVWEGIGQDEYGASLTKLKVSDPHSFSDSFYCVAEFDKVKWGHVDGERTLIALSPLTDLLIDLPSQFRTKTLAPKRKHAMVLPKRHAMVITYRVAPPAGYVPFMTPPPVEKQFGDVKLSATFRRMKNAFVATYRLNTGDGRLEPNEVEQFHKYLISRNTGDYTWTDTLSFRRFRSPQPKLPVQLVQKRDAPAPSGPRRLADRVARKPNDLMAHSEFAIDLMQYGFSLAARDQIDRALQLSDGRPGYEVAATHLTAAKIYMRGLGLPRGIVSTTGDSERVRKELRASLMLDGTNNEARVLSAVVSVLGRDGFVVEDQATLLKALRLIQSLDMSGPYTTFEPTLLLLTAPDAWDADKFRESPPFYVALKTLALGTEKSAAVFKEEFPDDRERTRAVVSGARVLAKLSRYDLALNLLARFPQSVASGRTPSWPIDRDKTNFVDLVSVSRQTLHGWQAAARRTPSFQRKPESIATTPAVQLVRKFVRAALANDVKGVNSMVLRNDGEALANRLLAMTHRLHRNFSTNLLRSTFDDEVLNLAFRQSVKNKGFATSVDYSVTMSSKEKLSVEFIVVETPQGLKIAPGVSPLDDYSLVAEQHLQQGRISALQQVLAYSLSIPADSDSPETDLFVQFTNQQPWNGADLSRLKIGTAILLAEAGRSTHQSQQILTSAVGTTQDRQQRLVIQKAWLRAAGPENPGAVDYANRMFAAYPDSAVVAREWLRFRTEEQLADAMAQIQAKHKLDQNILTKYKIKLAVEEGNFGVASMLAMKNNTTHNNADFAWNRLAISTQVSSFISKIFGVADYEKTPLPGDSPEILCARAWQLGRRGRFEQSHQVLKTALQRSVDPDSCLVARCLCQGQRAEYFQLKQVATFYYEIALRHPEATPAMQAIAETGLKRTKPARSYGDLPEMQVKRSGVFFDESPK